MSIRRNCARVVFGVIALWASPASGQPSVLGEWGGVFDLPHVPVHMVLFHTEKVLFWAYDNEQVALWDLTSDAFVAIPNATNMFCSGQTLLADGRLLVAGGNISDSVGLPDANIFDSETETWTTADDMAVGRWYPNVTLLPDGRALVASGDTTPDLRATIPEILDPDTGEWTPLLGAEMYEPLYPFHFVLPNGSIFWAGGWSETYTLDLATQEWSWVGWSSIGGGAAVMYRPGEIMKCGGWHPAVSGTDVIDMNAASPQWEGTEPMDHARDHHNLVILANGQVVVVGGTTEDDEPGFAVLEAELWDPDSRTWSPLDSIAVPRMYHSTAILLPDARVLSAGGDSYPSGQIFTPPYLFRGPRPTLSAAPPAAAYGATFVVTTPDAPEIGRATLVRPAATTHAFDHSQRFLELPIVGSDSTTLTLEAPPSCFDAPPGYYMLFVLTDQGVPSSAKFVRLGEELFVRGNVNGDDDVDVGDAVFLLAYLFDLGPEPDVLDAGDANDDESVNIADVIYLLAYLFESGTPPPAPFPDPGLDPTP